jgi:sigma-E factor negative regulatory protein RseA
MSIAPADDAPSAEDLTTEELLSAWMDGEAPARSGPHMDLVDRWCEDVAVRSRWAHYHQIGDALRSPELAGGDDDARFLAAFRERLAHEPPLPMVDSAPMSTKVVPLAAWRRTRDAARRWTMPVGIAAGVAMVTSALWLSPGQRQSPDQQMSSANNPAIGALVAASAAIPLGRLREANGFAPVSSGDAIQAVDFEPYLSAHKQFQTSTAPGPATGFLRSAVYESR